MTDYTKSTNFAAKDSLMSGDPDKVIKGAEIDTEFNSLQTASASKIDKLGGATTGNLAEIAASGGIADSGRTVSGLVSSATPAGSILMYGDTTAPTGFLLCDGSAVSRTTFSNLFAVIGTAYGNGDGSTTFNVPDLQGRSPLGYGNGDDLTNRTLGASGGEEEHTMTEAELVPHTHEYLRADVTSTGAGGSSSNMRDNDVRNTESTGGGDPFNVMHPFTVVNFIIKT